MTETQMFSETGGLSCDDASADGQEFHQAPALTCLTSPLTGRQRGEIEVGGGVRACVRVRACIKAKCLLSQLMEPVQDSVRNQVCV